MPLISAKASICVCVFFASVMCNFVTVLFYCILLYCLSEDNFLESARAKTYQCLTNGKVVKDNFLIKIDIASEYKK